MSRQRPFMKFYPSDWRSDPQLRMCGLPARGLWMEMLTLMHEAQPYGHLLISGNAPTDAQLGVLVGAPPAQIPDLLRELETAGVFSRTRAGVIYSRRMTRDEKRAQTAKKNGEKGGNPTLRKTRKNPNRVNHLEKPHISEARVQMLDKTNCPPPSPRGIGSATEICSAKLKSSHHPAERQEGGELPVRRSSRTGMPSIRGKLVVGRRRRRTARPGTASRQRRFWRERKPTQPYAEQKRPTPSTSPILPRG